jgi:hypothetical protein
MDSLNHGIFDNRAAFARLGSDSSNMTRWRFNIEVSCATKARGGNGDPSSS